MSTAAAAHPDGVAQPVAAAGLRLHELDGLRGWAALSVVLYHIFWETFGVLVPGFRNPVTGFLFGGPLAVSIFFVLSGEALSSAYFAGRGEAAVIKLAAQRYTRLTLPIAATCAIVYGLAKAGLVFNQAAGDIVRRPDWLGGFLHDPAGIGAYARYALLDVYTPLRAYQAVDPFLWTMHYEMLGSFVVFGVLLAWRHVRGAPVVAAVLAVLALAQPGTSQLSCFLFGVCLSHARMSGALARIQGRRLIQILTWGLVAMIAMAAGRAQVLGVVQGQLPFYAVPLVLAVFCNRRLSDLFATGPSRLLGKLSFPLYLVQFPVLVSFTSWAIVFAQAHGGLDATAIWTIALASLALSLACAWAFLPVERATRWVGRQVSRRLIAP